MPEPVTAAEGEQGEQTATTQPQSAVDKPETTSNSEGQSSDAKAVMDYLDIPPELQQQIAPIAEKPEPKTEETPEPEAETEEEIPEVEGKKKKEEEQKPEEESDEDESEGEDEDKEEEPPEQKVDKRLKRIKRLTRQRADLEKQVDHVLGEVETRDAKIEELQGKLQKFEKNGAPPVGTIPQVGPWMPDKETAESYSDLSQKKATAEATLKWCDRYRDGVNITENGQQRFIEPDEIATQRRTAELSLMEVNPEIKVIEREAKQTFKQHRANFDKAAAEFWPELNDKSSESYQMANTLMEEFPSVKASPQANYAIGLVLEGMKSLAKRIEAQKNGNGKVSSPQKRRDIDPKVFTTPRVPIAPHTPEPPTRESTSSSTKKLQEAESSLMADPDGSAESLARVFEARDSVRKPINSRSPVSS